MSNILQDFLAARSAKKGKQTVTNAGAPVTREEFNTVLLAVNALIEDVDLLTSPDKLQAVMNAAISEAAKTATPTANARTDRARLAPSDADEIVAPPRVARTATVANTTATTRKPLALPADRSHLAPKGE